MLAAALPAKAGLTCTSCAALPAAGATGTAQADAVDAAASAQAALAAPAPRQDALPLLLSEALAAAAGRQASMLMAEHPSWCSASTCQLPPATLLPARRTAT
jgi:hypothetical protein